MEIFLEDLKRRMSGVVDLLTKELGGLRAGRASVNLLEPVMVEAYGSMMSIGQVGTISAPEPRLLTVQVWDTGLVKAVEKAIREANLGLNPASDGAMVRVPLPDLNEERRKELIKIASKYAESAKVSIRNVRRDGIDHCRKMEKSGDISEDDEHKFQDEVQKLTDSFTKKVDEMLSQKEKDILHI